MPNVISALGLVKDGEKSVLLNLSNARTVDYDTLEEMTEAQKQGVIICPDYPLNEGNMIPASAISYGNGSAETAIRNTQSSITSIFQSGTTATQAISSGTYFYLNGVLVRAKTAIASGATFTLNTNYEVVTVGGALVEQATVEEISTGISGLIAYKCGKLVNLIFKCPVFTAPGNQWNLIGNLPSELHPKTALLFLGFDNSITASTVTLLPVQMRIKENGEILWYSFDDKRKCSPQGVITYFTE